MMEPAHERVVGLSKHRIEALVDGIFAVAMTLLVLDIKMPESVTYASEAELWRRLVSLEHAAASYAVSFVMLSVYWIAHHFQFHFIQRTDRGVLWINLYLLLCITLVPFTTDLVGDNVHLRLPILLYGANLLLIGLGFAGQLKYLRGRPWLASPDFAARPSAELQRRIVLLVLVPVLSMGLMFYSPRLALYLYLALPLLHMLPGRLDRMTMPSSIRRRRSP